MSDLQRVFVIVLLCTVLGIVLWWFVNPVALDPVMSEAAPPVRHALIPQASQENHPAGHPEPEVAHGEAAAGAELAPVPDLQSSGPDTGRIELLVIEKGTHEPIPNSLVISIHNPVKDHPFGTVHGEYVTNQFGMVAMEDLPPGLLRLRLGVPSPRTGTQESVTADVLVVAGETAYQTVELPARVEFKYRLVREDGTPVAHFSLQAGYETEGLRDSRIQHLEPVRTRADGTFVLRAPEGEPRHSISAEGALFLLRADERFDGWLNDKWSNPHVWNRLIGQDRAVPRDLLVRTDQVIAVARLVNRPRFGLEWRHSAWIEPFREFGAGVRHAGNIDEDSTLRFVASPGGAVSIRIERHRDMWSPKGMLTAFDQYRTGMSSFGLPIETIVDHFVTVIMPNEGGLFEFDIVYEDRLPIEVRVLKPEDKPAEGVIVEATMADTLEVAKALQTGSVPRNMPVYGNVATDAAGVAHMELPEKACAVLRLVPGSLPPEAQTFQPVVFGWSELHEGVTLRLGHSHLVWGEVVDEEGNPIHGAYVTLGGGHVWREARGAGTRSNEEGIFELNIADGPDAAAAMRADVHVQALVPWSTTREPWDLFGVGRCEMDSPEPVRIVLHRASVFRLDVRYAGTDPEELELAIRYEHPDFSRVYDQPVATTLWPLHHTHSTPRLPLGKATLLVKCPGDSMEKAVEVAIPETITSTYNRLTVDLPVR